MLLLVRLLFFALLLLCNYHLAGSFYIKPNSLCSSIRNSDSSSSGLLDEGGDKLPPEGVEVRCSTGGILRVISSETLSTKTETMPTIVLDTSLPGWGTGIHPTTNLCLDFLLMLQASGEEVKTLVDYGCGSGVLGIAARKLSISQKVIGVDVEEDALEATQLNWRANFGDQDEIELIHTRAIVPGFTLDNVDLILANILVGALIRPSMVAVLVSAVKVGGRICFSGIRPDQVETLKQSYNRYLDFEDSVVFLSGTDVKGSVQNYGFDVADWARVVARRRCVSNVDLLRDFSEDALK